MENGKGETIEGHVQVIPLISRIGIELLRITFTNTYIYIYICGEGEGVRRKGGKENIITLLG